MESRNKMKHVCACVFAAMLTACVLAGCAQGSATSSAEASSASAAASSDAEPVVGTGQYTKLVENFHNTDLGNGWQPTGSMQLDYATCFTIDYFEGGYQLACLYDGGRYLIVPEGAEVPEGIAEDIVVLQQPASDLYLVASDTACLFDALDAIDTISVSGIKPEDWYISAMTDAMENGSIIYGGKYSAPDYELLVSSGVKLSIQSTMINHMPDVREKLVELGIPVFVEMSSYETEPLGRAEWVKLYGALFGKDDLAAEQFQKQVKQVEAIDATPTGKTVAFFYINSNGGAVVRKPGDYVTTMIAQAGGTYAFDDLDAAESGTSSVTLEMERFYATAKDADIIIYNSSIDGSIDSLADLLAKNELLGEFKAVQDGNVWATDQNMYQQMMESGGIIADFNAVVNGATGELTYMRQLT